MITRFAARATAFSLSALITIAVLGSLNLIAASGVPADAPLMASAPATQAS